MKSIFLKYVHPLLVCLFLCAGVYSNGSSNAYAQSEKVAPKAGEGMQPETNDAQKIIVFVHGAWGGGWDYKVLERLLEEKGHKVYRVTLTGHGERIHLMSREINLDTHIMDVVNTLKYENIENIILVGHSYGGMVVTGVADRVPERIKHLVYMDALLPISGESVLGMQPAEAREEAMQIAVEYGNGISIPPFWPDWEKSNYDHHPFGTLQQAISLTNQEEALKIPTTYILAYEESPETADFKFFAERAKSRDWNYQEWQSHHNTQHHAVPQYVEFLDKLE